VVRWPDDAPAIEATLSGPLPITVAADAVDVVATLDIPEAGVWRVEGGLAYDGGTLNNVALTSDPADYQGITGSLPSSGQGPVGGSVFGNYGNVPLTMVFAGPATITITADATGVAGADITILALTATKV
jgi:hypothetical protein